MDLVGREDGRKGMDWFQCVMLLPLSFPLFLFSRLDVGEEGGC